MISRIIYAILRRTFNLYVSLFDGKKFKTDKNYNLSSINKCFTDRKSNINNPIIFERVSSSYNKAKLAQADSSKVYQVGNEWVPIYKKYMSEIMNALNANDTVALEAIYNNFMREKCSTGLTGIGGFERMTSNYFSGNISLKNARIYMKDVIHRFNIWSAEFGDNNDLDALKGPLIGNPYGHYIEDEFIEGGSHYNHYYASKIRLLQESSSHSKVLELGGGYGNMAYYLMRDSDNTTYIDFDLPENFALTAFYLLSAFPDKNIALYGEIDLEKDNLDSYDAILMPNFEIDKMHNNSVDLVFNSYSLAEMSNETIKNYIAIFNRVSKKYIFHLNHTKYSSMSADHFPINMDKFELVSRSPAKWNMAINFAMDEFEFLYQVKK
tara:strand:+ start:1017 stop:2159 length:1143 start_codon:yes stop_codon:yes gene_type:complete